MTEFNFKVGDRIRRERLTINGGAVITAIGEGKFLARGARTNVPDTAFDPEGVFAKAATDHGPWVLWSVPPCPFEVGDWVYRNKDDFPGGPQQVASIRRSQYSPGWVVRTEIGNEYSHQDNPSNVLHLEKVDPPAFTVGDYVVVKHVVVNHQQPCRVLSVFYADHGWRFRIEGHDYGSVPNNGHVMNWWTKVDPPVEETPKTYRYEVEVSAEAVDLAGLAGVLSVRRVES